MRPLRSFVFVAAAVALVGCATVKPDGTGGAAPDFTVQKVGTTEKLKLSSLKGKVVLVDFWATWCGPCKMIEPEIDEAYAQYKDKGFEVVAVSAETANVLEQFSKDRTSTYPIYQDFAGMANGAFQVDAFPTQVIIDREGNVAWKQVGAEPGTLKKEIDKMMGS